ncbi:hypothetical protein DFO83_102111 [Idiomarina loihiensis]|uniref:Cap15 family cyclic dinucleotide receptor domain-containing protein n=1 Tax=Idiomarina TaxID=135575 RepID=UPI000D70D95D|nr:hypothetical protein [Idiomarina]PWW40293.1 hypothetical protein DFO83_102111 [Idiomarina loihiensis]TDP49984.1 hypothetical protein DET58_102107 [Idiomarina loihiensis]TDS24664.1 hypothetical protein DET62_102273 [Idiomarina sp. H2]
MISLIPIGRAISSIAVAYAVVSCLILWGVYDQNTSFISAISIATSGSALLHLLVLGTFYFGWEKIWNHWPILNKIFFPNLNGTWDMNIHWEWEGKKGTSKAKAVIKQDFLKLGIDVEAEDSDSQTLLAKPKKDVETGRAELYYVFLTTPKHKSNTRAQEPYKGAAVLKLGLSDNEQLQGNYFTSRRTVGYYELKRIVT